ncbi:MAG: peptidylprolyl isomerase [Patescibacteria group bacterium]|nr:peptidylprolyl isomerase [Patescibacteria group bacterium]MDD4304397.1 peptidylprolyl isomerase [Patescibacteria group bacterium]MDD4695420.1 peptidylprolyl isomerase [Patescibacteria group bacterium]
MKKIIVLSLFLLIFLSGCNKVNNEEKLNKNNIEEKQVNNLQSDNIIIEEQNTPSSTTKIIDKKENMKIVMKTNKGNIELELYKDKAPITVENFVKLINERFYNNIKFHRVIPDFMIQTGDPATRGVEGKDFTYDPYNNPNNLPIAGTGGPGYKFEDEFNKDLLFDRPGRLAMANSGPNTNGSQIFITHVPTDWLNGKHTIFGQVINGQDIVNSITQGDYIVNINVEK